MTPRLSTRDAALIYRIPESTIRRWWREERLSDPQIVRGRCYWLAGEIDQLARLRGDAGRLRRPPVMTDTHRQAR